MRLRFDTYFRPVEGVCRGRAGCLYSPEQDRLVSVSAGAVSVFSDVVRRVYLPIGRTSLEFNTQEPTFILQASIGAVALSGNGRWLAVEVKNKGIEVVDLATSIRKQVVYFGPQYGFGRDPLHELAVSNDGQFVADMGENAGFQIIRVTPECETTCEIVSGSTTEFIPAFYFAAHPVFDSSGKRLSFYAASRGHGSRRVTIHTPGYDARTMEYVALGDSFSSGEGETSDLLYKLGTNDAFEKCHVSTRSYPFLLARWMEIPTALTESVACAGARTLDIIGKATGYLGQGARLGSNGLELSENETLRLKAEALDTFQPGRIHQADFIDRYQPRVVTLGVGGNDAGFMAKLKTCAMPDLCEWAGDPAYRYASGIEIQNLFRKLREVYEELLSRSPDSLLYAEGYPDVIAPEGICDPMTATLLTYGERVFMQEGIRYLNQVIKSAAESAGIAYVDIESAFGGRLLCSAHPLKAVNGLRAGDDVAVGNVPLLKVIGNESFHPAPLGHAMISEHIQRVYGDLRAPRVCGACTSATGPPPLPDYWEKQSLNHGGTHAVNILESSKASGAHPVLKLKVESGVFQPMSTLRIELHSNPYEIGRLVVASDGTLVGNIFLPQGLSEGYHTLHLYGVSGSHEPIDVYEVISYEVPEETQSAPMAEQLPGRVEPGTAVLGVVSDVHKTQHSGRANKPRSPGESVTVLSGVVLVTVGVIITVILVLVGIRTKNSSQDPGG